MSQLVNLFALLTIMILKEKDKKNCFIFFQGR